MRRGTRGSRNRPARVIDLGLRLADIEGLEREPVSYPQRSSPRDNLRENGATDEEIELLVQSGSYRGYAGERVELNAMTSDQFIAWLKSKLDEHGVRKVIPKAEMLRSAYRRAVFLRQLDLAQAELAKQIKADAVALPTALPKKVERLLRDAPELSWDQAIWSLVAGGGDGDTDRRGSQYKRSLRNPDKRRGQA